PQDSPTHPVHDHHEYPGRNLPGKGHNNPIQHVLNRSRVRAKLVGCGRTRQKTGEQAILLLSPFRYAIKETLVTPAYGFRLVASEKLMPSPVRPGTVLQVLIDSRIEVVRSVYSSVQPATEPGSHFGPVAPSPKFLQARRRLVSTDRRKSLSQLT